MYEFLIGFSGVLCGAAVSYGGIWLKYHLDTKDRLKFDAARKDMLSQMLENPSPENEWRKLETLSRVIGADYETTTRLLIELGARGSEKQNEVWALKSKKPLQ
jgi:hypothetical protein